MKIKQISIALIGAIFLNSACASDTTQVKFKTLTPEPLHQMVFTTALQLVASYHYQKPQINDQFSSNALDNYLADLDPSKVYFLQSDVAEFEKYRYILDETIFSGDVKPGFEVFNKYQQRLQERINYALFLLTDSANFDYSTVDSFMTDRENASYTNTIEELNNLWQKKLKYECLSLKSQGKDFKTYSETIRKRYDNLLKLASKTKSEDVFQVYVNAFTGLADPHTNYYSPRASADFNTQMSLSLEGIGATLQTESEYTKIREVVKGGPADKSKKIHAGDRIVGVAQGDSDIVNVVDWRLDDVVSLIRGKKGTIVRLEIIPASEPGNKTKIIEIKRDKIVLEDQSAKSSIKLVTRNGKKYKYGVISLPAFYIDFAAARKGDPNYKSTTRDVKKLIAELKKQKVDGLIIDLRNNGGGSLQEAVELTGLFIKTGPVVQVKDGAGGLKDEVDRNPEEFYDGPVAVLVNRFSASASEIFAAAIQDYGRGIVLGEKTFGKGTVQNMVSLNEFIPDQKPLGEVKLTIAKFYRVTGSSTQHRGVIPDIEFPSVYANKQFGEDASKYALPWDQIAPTKFDAVNIVTPKLGNAIQQHNLRMSNNKEYGYLAHDIAFFKEHNAKVYQTLNMATYKLQNDKIEADKKAREEERKLRKVTAPDLIMDETLEVMLDLK
ncbi:MAG: carboxy terminal-processing peptidase [Bacteroidia bacterium]|nr:carboxy terminal-processing peptidase [Bacteroidia bacterium]